MSQAADIGSVSLGLVRAACPALQKHIPEVPAAGQSYVRRAAGFASQLQSTRGWAEAENYLGSDAAIAALAITMQRADDGQVVNPGAYLRTVIQRGINGELRISRSLFALPDAKDASVPKQSSRTTAPHRGFPLEQINWFGWADLVRERAAKPIPDVEAVADAFRSWYRMGNIDLAQPSIEKALIGFCTK